MSLSVTEICLAGMVVALLVAVVFLWRRGRSGSTDEALLRAQLELSGRLKQLAEQSALEQDKIARAIGEQKLSLLKLVDEKLLQMAQNVGEGLRLSGGKTEETLAVLRERLAKIDVAQQKITSLSEQVVSLQEILSNKQARGAFGEIQLTDIVKSMLPPSAYRFQAVLSNQKRADCLLCLPGLPGNIVIDSKFPLESYQALQRASTEREKQDAVRFFRSSVSKHIKDIAEKYIIPGETADSALMFLPAESVYAELYAGFEDIVALSYKERVWIVSPTTLMATLNTVRAVLKDVQMQQQAGLIRREVGFLADDVARLGARVESLSRHFEQAEKDIDDIKISSVKICRRAVRIEGKTDADDRPAEEVLLPTAESA